MALLKTNFHIQTHPEVYDFGRRGWILTHYLEENFNVISGCDDLAALASVSSKKL